MQFIPDPQNRRGLVNASAEHFRLAHPSERKLNKEFKHDLPSSDDFKFHLQAGH